MIRTIGILVLILSLNSCKKRSEKNRANINEIILKTEKKTDLKIPDFLDKKYFHGYQLSPTSDFPILTHSDKNIGSFVISYINYNIKNQKEWFDFDINNNIIAEDDPDEKYFTEINKIIQKKLEPQLDNYAIIAEHIPPKYLDNKTLSYIYPYKKTYYLYNKEKKNWDFISEKIITDGSDEKNITKLVELNNMIGIKENNDINAQINMSAKWNGTYNFTINEKSDDWRDMQDVKLTIKSDSVIFHVEGYQIAQDYKLKINTANNNHLALYYDSSIYGDESAVLQRTKDFGIVTFDNNKYFWKCPYIDESFTDGKKKTYILKKEAYK